MILVPPVSTTFTMSSWFSADTFIEVPEANLYPNVSVFNRKIYTFSDDKEVYLKYSKVNSQIQSQDELAHVDTRSCMTRISQDEYINIGEKEEGSYFVIGQLSPRYIEKNQLNSFNPGIKSAEDCKIVSITEAYDSSKLTLNDLKDSATRRMGDRFEHFMSQIRRGSP